MAASRRSFGWCPAWNGAWIVPIRKDIENRNNAQKQATAEQEQQKAEVIETFANYRTNFHLKKNQPLMQVRRKN